MLKNRGIIRNQNHLNQTRYNFVISSYFPPKLTPTTTIPTQSITFLVPKKKKKKPIYLDPNSLLFSPFNGVEEATNSDPNSDLILHLLLSLHLDRRIRWPSAGLTTTTNNKGLRRWEVCSDAGGCSVQDSGVCRPAFWGERVDRLGSSPGRELSKGHEHCAGQWNYYRWLYHFFFNQSCACCA